MTNQEKIHELAEMLRIAKEEGKQQATKEFLEEVNKEIESKLNTIRLQYKSENTDKYYLEFAEVLILELKVQISKLGEQQ